MNENPTPDWSLLGLEQRAELLRAGIGHPGETPAETRARLKHQLDLLDDDDLTSLLEKSSDTLARMRVNGDGPTPIRVARCIFYRAQDVLDWITRHRDVVDPPPKSPLKSPLKRGVAARSLT